MHEAGDIVSGRFRLVAKLGEGGMGVTWKAFDQRAAQDVVIKFLKIADAKDWKTIELFEREIDVLRSLDHPSIPDLVVGDANVDGDWFLVQELAPGESIQNLIDRRARFDEAILRGVADQVLEILVYLQDRSPPIVHRDVKPDNLVIDTSGNVRLVDFGAASLALTDTKLGGSTVVGTFGYMAPEQFRGISRAATDLYGLGMTLVVMATGMAPERLETVGLKIQFEEHSTLSAPFVRWLSRMLEPDADKRFESATVALDRLRNLDREDVSAGLPERTNAEYLTRLHLFSQLQFASLDITRTNSGVNMVYRRKNFRVTMIIFTIIGVVMALATFLAAFIEIGIALLFALFAIVFGGIGVNDLIYLERLRFQDDGQWSWKKRSLLGKTSHVGTTRDIVRFDAAPSGMKVNNQPLYQITMNSYRGDHQLFSGLRYGEAVGISRELSAVTGAELVPERQGVRHHAVLAFDEALRAAAEKGGIIGGLAKAARRSPSLQRTLNEANQATTGQQHARGSSQSGGAQNSSQQSSQQQYTPQSSQKSSRRSSPGTRDAAAVDASDDEYASRSYVFEPEDYEEE